MSSTSLKGFSLTTSTNWGIICSKPAGTLMLTNPHSARPVNGPIGNPFDSPISVPTVSAVGCYLHRP